MSIINAGKPVQSDWSESDTSDPSYIQNKPALSTVATSGSYNDLSNKPTIPDSIDDLAPVTGASSGYVLTYNGSTVGWAAPSGGLSRTITSGTLLNAGTSTISIINYYPQNIGDEITFYQPSYSSNSGTQTDTFSTRATSDGTLYCSWKWMHMIRIAENVIKVDGLVSASSSSDGKSSFYVSSSEGIYHTDEDVLMVMKISGSSSSSISISPGVVAKGNSGTPIKYLRNNSVRVPINYVKITYS